jgi:hypothetical protein
MAISDPKKFVVICSGTVVLSGFSLVSILMYGNPDTAGIELFIFLYLSLFILSVSAFTLFGFGLRRYYSEGLLSVV